MRKQTDLRLAPPQTSTGVAIVSALIILGVIIALVLMAPKA